MSESNITDQIDQIGVQLSALMDGELPRDELRLLLRRFEADAQLAQRWSRYQFARSVMRRQIGAPLRADFAESLARRLVAEAAPAPRRAAALLRWVGGGAIAASVAVVALVLTRPAMQNPATSIAAAAAPAAIQDTRTPRAVQVPTLQSFDYAQPASYDTAPYGVQPYDMLRRRYEPIETGNGGIPYVLLTAPLLPQPAPENKAEAPPSPPQ